MSPLAYWLYPQRCPASIGLVILRNRASAPGCAPGAIIDRQEKRPSSVSA